MTPPKDRTPRSGSGRRSDTRTPSKSGRYVRSAIPTEKTTDIAFDATVRAAAPHQLERRGEGSGLAVEMRDIRKKIRERKIGTTIVFVVDSSGSMGANKRMTAVKGAVLSLLLDAYQKRDRVGLVAFKGDRAEVLLAPTSSVELARQHLEHLPTGGKTPLAHGLMAGYELLQGEMRKSKKVKPFLVLISDGKANVVMGSGDVASEVAAIANEIRHAGIQSLVIDTETGLIGFKRAADVARMMGGSYRRLDDLRVDTIMGAVMEYLE